MGLPRKQLSTGNHNFADSFFLSPFLFGIRIYVTKFPWQCSLLDQSNGNSGLESSGNDNPSYTNSSSAMPPASTELIESAAPAIDVDSVENGPGTKPEQPAKRALRSSNVPRGRKRVLRSTARGRAT